MTFLRLNLNWLYWLKPNILLTGRGPDRTNFYPGYYFSKLAWHLFCGYSCVLLMVPSCADGIENFLAFIYTYYLKKLWQAQNLSVYRTINYHHSVNQMSNFTFKMLFIIHGLHRRVVKEFHYKLYHDLVGSNCHAMLGSSEGVRCNGFYPEPLQKLVCHVAHGGNFRSLI